MKAGFGHVSEVKKVKSQGITRIMIDLPIEAHKMATDLFDESKVLVTVAPDSMQGAYGIVSSEGVLVGAEPDYGQFAKYLDRDGFFRNPKVWVAAGSDEDLQEWTRKQPCVACSQPGEWVEKIGEHRCQFAHVRRSGNAGTAHKPVYSGVPLCHACHQLQHNSGESAIDMDFELASVKNCEAWARSRIKELLGYESYKRVPPEELIVWARQRDIESQLPAKYREAA